MKLTPPPDHSFHVLMISTFVNSVVYWHFTEWGRPENFIEKFGEVATIPTPVLEQIGGSLLVGLILGSMIACLWGFLFKLWKRVSPLGLSPAVDNASLATCNDMKQAPPDHSFRVLIISACVASVVFWYFMGWEHSVKSVNEFDQVEPITRPLLEQIWMSSVIGLILGSIIACAWGFIFQMWNEVTHKMCSHQANG